MTHAMIPRFSVPGTSLGMEEAESCLVARMNGASRAMAGRALMEQGMESRIGKRLEKMIGTAVAQAKAIWPAAAENTLQGLGWVGAVCGRVDHPILDMNRWALDHGVNAICFCRSSILFFRHCNAARVASHTLVSAAGDGSTAIVPGMFNSTGGTP
jgi:hypothetical protein